MQLALLLGIVTKQHVGYMNACVATHVTERKSTASEKVVWRSDFTSFSVKINWHVKKSEYLPTQLKHSEYSSTQLRKRNTKKSLRLVSNIYDYNGLGLPAPITLVVALQNNVSSNCWLF